LITEVELAVREAGEDVPLLFAFHEPAGAQRSIDDLGARDLHIFHLQVITPRLAALKNQVGKEAYLPEDRYLVLAVLSGDDGASRKALEESAKKAGGGRVRLTTSEPPVVLDSVCEYARKKNLRILSINTMGPSLEDVFLEITEARE